MKTKTIKTTPNQRIKELRKSLRLTQKEFAKLILISAGQLACIETDKRVVNERMIKMVCNALNVRDHWLRTGEGDIFVEDRNQKYSKLIALFDNLKPNLQEYIFQSMEALILAQDSAP
jgi:transcriptional regulator with XRE-family HTH domain